MGVQQARMDIISNNLANLSVFGFKRSSVTAAPFSELLLVAAEQPNGTKAPRGWNAVGNLSYGAAVTAVKVDPAGGTLKETNRQLDLAIAGDGYFAVNVPSAGDPGRVAYTRDGTFSRDAGGYLATSAGHRVLNSSYSPILLPDGEISVSPAGVISAGGAEVDSLAVVVFDDANQMIREGNGYFAAPGLQGSQHDNPLVRQGFLERSNVDPNVEITNMLTALKAYEAGQKLIQAHDELLGKAINQVGTLR
jgi:flagellar basal-body rod protein FlgG